jgi:AAA family ATP:ADP antiporter
MVAAGVVLLVCMALTAHIRTRVAARRPAAPLGTTDGRGGFRLVLGDRYLRLIALGVLALNLVNTTGDFVLARLVQDHAAALSAVKADREAYIGAFYGQFQTAVTVLTAAVQFFLVARIFRGIGIAGAVRVLPILALAGYGALTLVPLLAVAQVVKIIENSGDYSLQSTTQQALFLRTSREAKYKAKAAIDTFVVRFGDLGSTLLVAAGVHFGLGVRGFSLANTIVAGLWVAIAMALGRAWRRSRVSPARAPAPAPEGPPPTPA